MIRTDQPDDSAALERQESALPRPGAPSGEREILLGFIEAEDVDGALAYCHELALTIAGESFRAIAGKLEDTPAGLALRRVLIGTGQSYREDAKVVGRSAKNLHKTEGRILKRLGVLSGG